MSIPLAILFRTAATESIANWLKNILKPEYFGIKNNENLNQRKTFEVKRIKTWFELANYWSLKRKYEIMKQKVSKTKTN
jgi:hypothetical protein